jgi:voltage-gated potassium channel
VSPPRTPLKDFLERRIERAFDTNRILPLIITSITTLVVAFGVLMWIVDREDYPTLGLALWWAGQTVTTVGYGDVTPVEPAGRVVATGLMIVGFASLSLLTGVIASLLVNRRTTAQALSGVNRVEERLAEIERLLRSREPN